MPPKKSLKATSAIEKQFSEVAGIILTARNTAFRKVDSVLVELYWKIGGYISTRVASTQWGDGMVESLALYLEKALPDALGFNRRGFIA